MFFWVAFRVLLWCIFSVFVQFVFFGGWLFWCWKSLKLKAKAKEAAGRYWTGPAPPLQPAFVPAAASVLTHGSTSMRKADFSTRLCSRFTTLPGSPSFLLRAGPPSAGRSPPEGRSEPCKGCSPRPQSGADFIISTAVCGAKWTLLGAIFSSRVLPPKTKWRGASNQSSCKCIRVLPRPHPQST